MNRRKFLYKGGLIGGALFAGTPFLLPRLKSVQSFVAVERLYVSMGTTVRFVVFHEDEREAVAAVQEAQALIDEIHRLMSVQEPHSELSRWNRSMNGLDVPFHDLTARALEEAMSFISQTSGCFDPSIGSLVQSGRQERRSELPEERLGFWDAGTRRLRKEHPSVLLDLGGSAKGWAVDRAVEILRSHGIESALVNAGGDLRVTGHPPDADAWYIGIRDPKQPDDVFCELRLEECSVATSGSYERDGSTIVDPRDGQPVSFNGSATVIAATCGAADCLSTAAFVDPTKGVAREDVHLLIARPEGEDLVVSTSPGFPSLTLTPADSLHHGVRLVSNTHR